MCSVSNRAASIRERLDSALFDGTCNDHEQFSPLVQWRIGAMCCWLLDWGAFFVLYEWVDNPILLIEASDLGDILSSEEEQETSADGN